MLSETGDHDGALSAHREVLTIRQKLAAKKPSDVRVQTQFAESLFQVGQMLALGERPGESIAYFDRQEEVWIKLADSNPTVPEYRHSLAKCELKNATVLLRLRRPAEARKRCQRAVAQCESLTSAHPNALEYRLALAESLLRLGQAHQGENDLAAAAADWRRAVALLESVSAPTGELLFIEAGCHASLSSLTGPRDTPSSASGREALAIRAMGLLRQAAGMGYRDPGTYRSETALDLLRDRDDFRLLMMDLAMPDDPLAGAFEQQEI